MMIDFKKVFNPTPEQKREQREFEKNIVKNSYEKKWCVTCRHYNSQPWPRIGPECKLGKTAPEGNHPKEKANSCESYECDTTMWEKMFSKDGGEYERKTMK